MKIIGIETSCDETAVALIDSDRGLLGNSVYSQIPLHRQFGGIVPELAARDHLMKILPIMLDSLQSSDTDLGDVDGIAYTAGPGLMGALLVGASFACGLGWSLDKPVMPVNHLEGHILSVMLQQQGPKFPFVALLVSGGHTMLIHAVGLGKYSIIGLTLDDAAGECLDKVAKFMDLPYPGGPEIEKLAKNGIEDNFIFPIPMLHKGINFSFSGLKTHVRKIWDSVEHTEQSRADIALALQKAVFTSLVQKSKVALQQTGLNKLIVVGGVSANKYLRAKLQSLVPSGNLYMPKHEFCTDNAAMIAITGLLRHEKLSKKNNKKIFVKARWSITDVE